MLTRLAPLTRFVRHLAGTAAQAARATTIPPKEVGAALASILEFVRHTSGSRRVQPCIHWTRPSRRRRLTLPWLRCSSASGRRRSWARRGDGQVRYNEVLDALRVLSEGDDVWKFAQSYRGVDSHYKHDEVGRLWLKTDGVMEGVDLLECVAMWREADLFDRWFPLCHESQVLAQQGRVEMLAYMKLAANGLPIGNRDAVLHGYGVDALDDGFMMILGRSAQQGDFPTFHFHPSGALERLACTSRVFLCSSSRSRRGECAAPTWCTST